MKLLGITLSIALAAACGGSEKSAEEPAPKANPCAKAENPCANPCAAPKSLYERLGGKESITLVVDEFLANVIADDRINSFFKDADASKLRGHLIDQICEATGGPCKYTGRSMKESHAGMGVSEEHFNALVEDLVKALDKYKVPEKEKGELLGALAGMKGDIVEK